MDNHKTNDNDVPLVTAVSILHLTDADYQEDAEEPEAQPMMVLHDSTLPVPEYIQVPSMDLSYSRMSVSSLSLPSSTLIDAPTEVEEIDEVPQATAVLRAVADEESGHSPQSDETVMGSQESCFSSLLLDDQSRDLPSIADDNRSIVSNSSSRVSIDPPGSTGSCELSRRRPDPPPRYQTGRCLPFRGRRMQSRGSRPMLSWRDPPVQSSTMQPYSPRGGLRNPHRSGNPAGPRRPDPPGGMNHPTTKPGAVHMMPSRQMGENLTDARISPQASAVTTAQVLIPDAELVPRKMQKDSGEIRFGHRFLVILTCSFFFVAAMLGALIFGGVEDYVVSTLRGDSRVCAVTESLLQQCLEQDMEEVDAESCHSCLLDSFRYFEASECQVDGFCQTLQNECDCGPCQIEAMDWVDCTVSQDQEREEECSVDCPEL